MDNNWGVKSSKARVSMPVLNLDREGGAAS